MRHRRFLIIVAATVVILSGLVLAGFYSALGRTHSVAADSRCGAATYKRTIASAQSSPKLVIIAGSSAVSGINAEMLSKDLGIPVANMGLFASLGPGILLHEAKQVLKAGDTALIAFEYNSYTFDAPTAPAIDFVLTCDPGYWNELPLRGKVAYVFGLDLRRVVSLLNPSKGSAAGPQEGDEAQQPGKLTQFGDKRLDPTLFPPLSQQVKQRVALYQPIDIALNLGARGVSDIAEFVQWAKAHDVRVIATWPNTIDFPAYRRNKGFDRIAGFYRELGVPMAGAPSISLFPREMFYDTQYHLGLDGIVERTRLLAPALRAAMGAPSEIQGNASPAEP
jgi:hypothetical protein